MADDIVVSIFCLAYNHEEYIRDALEGFISQKTDFKYEVLINDDASTDKTADIIREYQNEYPDIIKPVFQTENQYSKHVNIYDTFIRPNVKGKYIAVCEGDDYWISPDKLQKQVDILERHPEYSACTHATMKYDYRTKSKVVFNPTDFDYVFDFFDIVSWKEKHFLTSSLMARKEYFNIPNEIRMGRVGDYPRAVYLATKGAIYYMKDVMSVYRYFTPGSWTSNNLTSNEKKISNLDDKMDFLVRLNIFTEKKYEDSIFRVMQEVQFEKTYWLEDYKKIMNDYREMVKCADKRKKVMIYANYYFPGLCKSKLGQKIITKRKGR